MNFFKSILLSIVLAGTLSTHTWSIGTDGDGSGKSSMRPLWMFPPQNASYQHEKNQLSNIFHTLNEKRGTGLVAEDIFNIESDLVTVKLTAFSDLTKTNDGQIHLDQTLTFSKNKTIIGHLPFNILYDFIKENILPSENYFDYLKTLFPTMEAVCIEKKVSSLSGKDLSKFHAIINQMLYSM